MDWVADAVAELATYPDVLHLQRTTAFGHYDDGFVLALQRRTDHLGAEAPAAVSRQRVWRIRARRIVIAAGAHERPVVFTDNDRPGIMLANGARTFLHRYGVKVGEQAVVFTTNDSAYLAAFDLHDAGVAINAIVDARARTSAGSARRMHRARHHDPSGFGGQRNTRRGSASPTRSWYRPGDDAAPAVIPCDVLLVSGGWNPAVHLFSQVARQAALRRRPRRVRTRRTTRRGQRRRLGRRRVRPTGLPAQRPRRRPTSAIDRARLLHDSRNPLRARADPAPTQAGPASCCGTCPTRMPRPASSSTCNATRRWPTWSARWAQACARWNTSSATPPSAPPTIRARRPASSPRASRPSCSVRRWRTSASPRSGRPTRRWRSPRSPAAAAATCSTPSG